MTLTLDDTVGGASANTYVSRDDATAYFEGHPFASAWTAAGDGTKDIALVYATRILDRSKWAGNKHTTTQALAFPRSFVPTLEFDAAPDFVAEFYRDDTMLYYDETTIPTPLVRATCELALQLLNAGTANPFDVEAVRIKSEAVGPIATEYFDSQDGVKGLALFPDVRQLVEHMLRSNESGIEVIRA